ncbi:uncharacterized protein K02A2.6-like [Pectinophora gossypiella]|uniref:uncharacterized protein K02A2.6-like n=1 Tax=Pectinophora gossypiella TaxID=13191 RepID=UPI00214E8314|nr:uncharacterized protein K02A2.6-like [Pectinophora gossypiella]
MFLSGYNYTIEYIRSAENSADFLSRASLPDQDSRAISDNRQLAGCDDRASYVYFTTDDSLPVTLHEMREETMRDATLSRVVKYILGGWPQKVTDVAIKPYFVCRTQLSTEKGCVMRGHKIVIPNKLRDTILTELHSAHLGIVKSKAEARSRFWFPGVDEAIEKMIASCKVCAQLRPSPVRAPLAPWPHPPQPFYRIHIDFLGPINGQSYLVIVDAYTKWVEAYHMTSTSTTAVISKLYEFISRYGLPHTLCSQSKAYQGTNVQVYSPGDNVLYKKTNVNKQFSWNRGLIIKRIGKVVYLVKDLVTTEQYKKHKNQLLLYKGTDHTTHHPWNCPIEPLDVIPSVPGNYRNQEETSHHNIMEEIYPSAPQPDGPQRQLEGEEDADEFHEAEEAAVDAASEESAQQLPAPPTTSDRPLFDGRLRSVPRVDYKKFFYINMLSKS